MSDDDHLGGRKEAGLRTPQEVRDVVLAGVAPLPPATAPLRESAGLVLAQDVVAGFDLPPFSNAAMDGFAVRSVDTSRAPARLRVLGPALAGHPVWSSVGPGEAVAIATGAPIPGGADAVVPVEEVTSADEVVTVDRPVEPGRHVRVAGEDVRAGDTVLRAGWTLGPGQLSAAAALGLEQAAVHPRPRVAIVPTGDEVVQAGGPLRPGQVYDAVSLPLMALVEELGAVVRRRPTAHDDLDDLDRALDSAVADADAIVTVGGVSMGPRDLIRSSGAEGSVTGFLVALRPAKPFAFGHVHGVPLFGLPGNPAAALAAFEELVRPALLAMLGKAPALRPAFMATLTEPLALQHGRLHLLRAEAWRENGHLLARPAGQQGPGMIHSLARATAWAVVPPGVSELPAGSPIEVRLLVEVP